MSSLEDYLLKDLYGRSVFSDLCLLFFHPAFPFSMRFSVHKAVIAQSNFFRDLLITKEGINKKDSTLSIDLKEAWTRCGFTINNNITSKGKTKEPSQASSPLLASHVRNVLEWFYCVNKQDLLTRILNDNHKNILNTLSLAILFDVPELADACVARYIKTMDLECIMQDIHLISQFPRQHLAYCKLRDNILFILFRHGPFHVSTLQKLPMDYLERVLSADSLFVMNEFHRYCLLKSILHIVAPLPPSTMGSNSNDINNNDKITETKLIDSHHPEVLPFLETYQIMTASEARNRKRKRRNSNDSLDELDVKRTKIASDNDDEDDNDNDSSNSSSDNSGNNSEMNFLDKQKEVDRKDKKEKTRKTEEKKLITTRYTFEPSIWSEKTQPLKKLLKTAINYSSMTFAQLSVVRQDRIVDEGIVFRALWQRESLERIVFPSSYNLALSQPPPPPTTQTLILHQERLLNTPKYRFSTSIVITSPKGDNKWKCEIIPCEDERKEGETHFDDSDSDNENDINCNNNNNNNKNNNNNNNNSDSNNKDHPNTVDKSTKVYKQTFHSQVERVLGAFYRVELEAEVIIPNTKRNTYHKRNNLKKQEGDDDDTSNINNNNSQLTCKFKLQPTKSVNRTTPQSNTSKLNYWIYCLNKHDKKEEKDGILKAVTEKKAEVSHSHKVVIPVDFKNMVKIDISVAIQVLEFYLQKDNK